ncbi:MAG: 30S ribosomal protein S12 methylthiotransferase RimO [Planctomycetota bacterium]
MGRPDAAADPATGRANYAVISLGCPKNTVDTEQMLGRLDQEGYRMVDQIDDADMVVVNTCGFIESARAESFDAIDEMLDRKRRGQLRNVVVTGCLAEREQGKLLQDRPEIDAMVGVFGRNDIAEVMEKLRSGMTEQQQVFRPAPIRPLSDGIRSAVTPRHFAYLKVSEGCDRLCTFCAIPKMRGKHYSKPIEQVVDEAIRLGESGVREMVIVAQDTTYYGMDLYGRTRLAELLRELDQIESIDWIRLMYFYPMYIDDDLIQSIADAKRIVPYIDMPLQHASDRMLKRMSRKTTRSSQEEIIRRLRGAIDSLVMRTTMICGFPGETDDDFDQLVDFTREMNFEHLGVFTYSVEPDTPAARLPHRVAPEIAEERKNTLMAVQQEIAFRWNEQMVGQAVPVIVDAPLPGQPGVWLARTATQAPDIDGMTYLTQTESDLSIGQIVNAEVIASRGYDLVAAALE